MSDMIQDSKIKTLQVDWVDLPRHTGPRVIDPAGDLRVIREFLTRDPWQWFIQFVIPGVVAHHGRVVEYSGFHFIGDLDPGDELFEGVQIFDPIDTIYVSEAAFEQLMSRYVAVIVNAVTERQRPEMNEPWWPELVANGRLLAERAAAGDRYPR